MTINKIRIGELLVVLGVISLFGLFIPMLVTGLTFWKIDLTHISTLEFNTILLCWGFTLIGIGLVINQVNE